MKVDINGLKVKFQGKILEIDLNKELSINEDIINSQLMDSPTSYYVLSSLKDKYIKERNALAREKEVAYSELWIYFKDSNEKWNNDYVNNKVLSSKKYCSICKRYMKAEAKANQFISLCKAYETRTDILRTINANLRRG